MVTSLYEWNILKRDIKQYTTNQSIICWRIVLYHLTGIFLQEYEEDLFKFIIFYLYFTALLTQFILHCFAEKSDDTGSAPDTPRELKVSQRHQILVFFSCLVICSCCLVDLYDSVVNSILIDRIRYMCVMFLHEYELFGNEAKCLNYTYFTKGKLSALSLQYTFGIRRRLRRNTLFHYIYILVNVKAQGPLV